MFSGVSSCEKSVVCVCLRGGGLWECLAVCLCVDAYVAIFLTGDIFCPNVMKRGRYFEKFFLALGTPANESPTKSMYLKWHRRTKDACNHPEALFSSGSS